MAHSIEIGAFLWKPISCNMQSACGVDCCYIAIVFACTFTSCYSNTAMQYSNDIILYLNLPLH